jgi:hypothetical protein
MAQAMAQTIIDGKFAKFEMLLKDSLVSTLMFLKYKKLM